MNKKQHIEFHKKLHQNFDELFADYISCTTGGLNNTIQDLIEWSYKQTIDPDKSRF